MPDGVVGVIIWTENVERLLAFYRNVLGLQPYSQHGDFVAFKFGDMRLSIGKHDGVKGESRDPYRIMINLGTRDIYAEYQRLLQQGVQFIRKPEREQWGGWVATFLDPDGNVLQLLQQPS